MANSLHEAAEKVVADLSANQQASLVAAAVVCQRSSLVCWDAISGEPLSKLISWQDTRASQWLAEQSLDVDAIINKTGLYPNAHFGASKMHWCLRHNSQVIAAASAGRLRIAPLAAYLIFALLQEQPYRVDPVNASRTLLMNLASLQWDKKLLALFSIDKNVLPTIVASQSLFGHLKLQTLSLPVKLLSGDQSAAAFAYGEPAEENCYINIGTGAFLYRSAGLQTNAQGLLNSVLHDPGAGQPPQYIREGTVNGAGSALQWFSKQQGVDDLPLALQQAVEQFSGIGDRAFFLNGIGGLGSPDWVADFPSRFIGEAVVLEKLLAIVESIVFLIYRNFILLNGDGKVRRVLLTGGLSNVDWICQSLANLLRLPVTRPDDCEASARGAAFLLAGRPDDWYELGQRVFAPVEENNSDGRNSMGSRYKKWLQLMQLT